MSKNELVTAKGYFGGNTPMAVILVQEGEEFFIPRSQITYMKKIPVGLMTEIEMQIPEWLAENKKGLIYE